jgi:hypothetical protein
MVSWETALSLSWSRREGVSLEHAEVPRAELAGISLITVRRPRLATSRSWSSLGVALSLVRDSRMRRSFFSETLATMAPMLCLSRSSGRYAVRKTYALTAWFLTSVIACQPSRSAY